MNTDYKKKNAASGRIRGDWLIKHWPQAELYKPHGEYDALFFSKVELLEKAKQFSGITIYDVCDPVTRMKEMARCCDIVTASTHSLAAELGCEVVPDRYDLDYFNHSKIHSGKPKEAVWFGFHNNIDPLYRFVGPLEKLGIRLKTITDRPVDVDDINLGFPITAHNPDYSALNYELIQSDIVLNPRLHKFKSIAKTHHAWLLNMPVATHPDDLDRLMSPESRNVRVVPEEFDVRLSVAQYKNQINQHLRKHGGLTNVGLNATRIQRKVDKSGMKVEKEKRKA